MKFIVCSLIFPELLTIIDNRRLSTSRSCSSSKLWSIDLRIVIGRMVQQDLAMEMDRVPLISDVFPNIFFEMKS